MKRVLLLLSLLMICPNDAEARSRPSGHNGPLKVTIEGPSDLGHLETYLTLEQWFCNFTAKPTGGRPPYRYEWTASDGGSYSGQTGRYYPTALGNQWVQVKVTDKNDESVTLKKDIMVHERLEILSAQASQADQGPEFLIAEHTNDTDQPQEWGNALTATTAINAGTATSATKLTTARNINGVSFNGSQDITITATPGAHTHAATDVTGFGILGHSDNLAQHSIEEVVFELKKSPQPLCAQFQTIVRFFCRL
jgi:hypothetical protein